MIRRWFERSGLEPIDVFGLAMLSMVGIAVCGVLIMTVISMANPPGIPFASSSFVFSDNDKSFANQQTNAYVITDKATGCQYVVAKVASINISGVTPRYNASGQVMGCGERLNTDGSR